MSIKMPARVDNKLVQSFRDAVKGQGDGRVSAADVREKILPRFADAGRLTETEKATLAWAVEEFKLTDAAKSALSDELTSLTGGPVFAWQREIGGAVGAQLNTQLTRKELDTKAADAFAENAVMLSGQWTPQAKFWHPDAGNGGTHVYEMAGDDGKRHLRYLASVMNKPELLTQFSPDTHAIYSVYHSGDEEEFGGILVHKTTGEKVALEPYNIVDLGYDLSRSQFEEIFGAVTDDDGNVVSDDEWEDYAYEQDVTGTLHTGGREVPLHNFAPAQVNRRDGALRDASKTIREALRSADTPVKVAYNYGAMSRVPDLASLLPMLADEAQSADWRDREKPNSTPTTVQAFQKIDASADAALLSIFQAGASGLTSGDVDKFLAGLGSRADLQHAVVDLAMTVPAGDGTDSSNTDDITVRAHLLVNTEEGDWFAAYERPKTARD